MKTNLIMSLDYFIHVLRISNLPPPGHSFQSQNKSQANHFSKHGKTGFVAVSRLNLKVFNQNVVLCQGILLHLFFTGKKRKLISRKKLQNKFF